MRNLKQETIQVSLFVKENIDVAYEIKRRVQFLKDYLVHTGAKGYVLGLSGGQDSTLSGKLAQIAIQELNAEGSTETYQFMAVRLPYGIQKDEADAQAAIDFVQPIRVITVNIQSAVDASVRQFAEATGEVLSDFHKGNVKAL